MFWLKVFRPELKGATLRLYEKEYNELSDQYQEDDPIELFDMLNIISIDTLKLDHVLFNITKPYQKNIRIALYRNMLNAFNNEIKPKHYNIIDALLIEKSL